jgi:hypothetical protein
MLVGGSARAHGFAADLPAPTPMRAAPFGIVTVYRPAQAEPASVANMARSAIADQILAFAGIMSHHD